MPIRSLLLLFSLLAATAAGQVKVKSESLDVHESRDVTSAVVKTLIQGDEVVIDMSITGPDNAQWCTIRENGQKDRLGYVHCDSLERPALRLRAPATPAQPASPRAPAAGSSSGDWDPANPGTLGDTRWMGYAGILASTFQFNGQQRQQILQLAQLNGIQACIQTTNSYAGPGMPPEMLSTSPITQCHWYGQNFNEQVFALITPEQKAARRASYETFTREVTGSRRVLEQRAQGK